MNLNPYLETMLTETADTLGLPDGVLFLSSAQTTEMDKYLSDLSSLYTAHQYHKVQPPVFEYYETFEKGSGEDIARRSFSFKDKEGSLLALRYDMTTPIARMAAMRYDSADLPLRFSYEGDVFREQPLHKGKLRQIRQTGIEIVGCPGEEGDMETIELLGKSLSVIDPNYRIAAGNVEIYRKIIGKINPCPVMAEAIHAALEKKDSVSLSIILSKIEADESAKKDLLLLTAMSGSLPVIRKKLSGTSIEETAEQTIKTIEKLPADIKTHVLLDFGMIKDFSYYTALTLEGYISKAGYPVANGGRYDRLFRSFGKDFPAVGFAIELSFCL